VLQSDDYGNFKAIKPDRSDRFEPVNKLSLTGRTHGNKVEAQFVMTTLDDDNGKAKTCSF
jgi:hypothetical protein